MLANPIGFFNSLFDPLRECAANKIQTPLTFRASRPEIEVRLGFLHKIALEMIENLVG